MKFALLASMVAAVEIDLMVSMATENHRPVKKASLEDVFEKPADEVISEDAFQKSRKVKTFGILEHYKKLFDFEIKKKLEKLMPNQELENAFGEHVTQYGKNFATNEEYQFRKEIFAQKDAKIKEWNSNPNNTHTLGHNEYSTWTDAELKRLTGIRPSKKQTVVNEVSFDVSDVPASVDWNAKGAVTPPQN